MAKVTGPLFSMNASGQIGKALVFAAWKGRNYVREYFIPQNPQSATQVNVRTAMTLLSKIYSGLSSAQKEALETAAAALNMSGMSLMMKRGMEAYVDQLTTAVTPVSVTPSGTYPSDVYTWSAS